MNVTELLNTGCIQYLYLKNCFLDSSKLHNIVAELNIDCTLKCETFTSLKLLDLRYNDIQESYLQKGLDPYMDFKQKIVKDHVAKT